MNLLKAIPVLLISSALALGNAAASTLLWESDFSNSSTFPYGETIVNKGNWVRGYSGIESGNNDDASIATLNGQSVLRVVSSITSAGNGFTTLRNSFTRITEPSTVRVQFGLALSHLSTLNSGASISFGPNDWDFPVAIGYNGLTGLRFLAADGSQTILARADMKTDYLYQFDLVLNYSTKTFTLKVTGEDVNGDPLDIPAFENIAFRSLSTQEYNGLGNIFISNNVGKTTTLYMDRIVVTEAIPEPATTAAVATGALLLGGVALGRRKKLSSLCR